MNTRPVDADGRLLAPPFTGAVRVLVVAPSLRVVGGQSVQAARLIRSLTNEPSVSATLVPSDAVLPKPFRAAESVPYVRTALRLMVYLWSLLTSMPEADIVHVFCASYTSFLLTTIPALSAAKLFGRPILVNYHSGEAEDHLARSRTARWMLQRADAIVVPSQYLVEVFSGRGLCASAIENHLDLDRLPFRHRSPVRPMFLTNRALEPMYGVATVLRAFRTIQRRDATARLTVAGGGSERTQIEHLARTFGLRHVRFTGSVSPSAMAQLYDETDVFLNGSKIDNAPLSIIEAAACGLVVVSTNAGGIPLMVSDEESGLLVSIDDANGMADAVQRVLREPSLTSSMVAAGRRRCQAHTWAAVRDRWLAVYTSIGNDSTRSAGRAPRHG